MRTSVRKWARPLGSPGERGGDVERIAKASEHGAGERRRLAGAAQDQKLLRRHPPTRARNSPSRSTIATSTAVLPDNVASATSRARGRDEASKRSLPAAGEGEDLGGPSGGVCRIDGRIIGAKCCQHCTECGGVDPAARRMQIEMSGGELGELGEAAGDGQPRDRMAHGDISTCRRQSRPCRSARGRADRRAAARPAPRWRRSTRRYGRDRRRGRHRSRAGSNGSMKSRNTARQSRSSRGSTGRR